MKWTKWVRVVESERVPKTYVEGFIHYRYPGNETDPIGMRVVEMPEDNFRQTQCEIRAQDSWRMHPPAASSAERSW